MPAKFITYDGTVSVTLEPGVVLDLDRLNPAANPVPHQPAPPRAMIEEPTLAELAANFTLATARWTAAGFPTVTAEQYAERAAICEPCEFWDGAARFGLGKCKSPGCGCTSFKRYWKTEQCKHPSGSKWPALPN